MLDVCTLDEENQRKHVSKLNRRESIRHLSMVIESTTAQNYKKRYNTNEDSFVLMEVRCVINELILFIGKLIID